MKATLVRWLMSFLHTTGLYGWWQRVRRPMEAGASSWPSVRTIDSIKKASDILEGHSYLWKRDGLWQLWDLISYPTKFEAALQRDEKAPRVCQLFSFGLDCDEFATWGCEAVRKLSREDLEAVLLQVIWQADGDALGAHHLCAVHDKNNNDWLLMGNWGLMGPFDNLQAAVRAVLLRAHGQLVCAWGCWSPSDLRDWRKIG